MVLSWLRRSFPLPSALRTVRHPGKSLDHKLGYHLQVENLENRLVPAIATWVGGGLNQLWSTASNWQGSVTPQAGDDLIFPGTGVPISALFNFNDFAPGIEFRSLTVTGANYTIGGHLILLSNGITANFINGQSSVNFEAIGLTGTQTFISGFEQTTLTIGSPIGMADNNLTLDGAGVINLNSPIGGDFTSRITKEGIGRTNVTNNNQFFFGEIVINNGEFLVSNGFGLGPSQVLVPGSGKTIVNANGTLGGNGGTWVENITLRGHGFGGNGTFFAFNGTNLQGIITLEANSTIGVINGQTLTIQTPGSITQNGGPFSLTKSGPGTLSIQTPSNYSGNTTINGGVLNLNANGTILSPNVTVNLGGTLTMDQQAIVLDRIPTFANVILNGSNISYIGRNIAGLGQLNFGTLTLASGFNNITMQGFATVGAQTELHANSLIRQAGATVNFNQTTLNLGTNNTSGNRVKFDSINGAPPANALNPAGAVPTGTGILPWATVSNLNAGNNAQDFATYGTGGTVTDGILSYTRATGSGTVAANQVGLAPFSQDYARSIAAVIPPAAAPPSFTQTGGGTMLGQLATGTYFVRFTYLNALGETTASPVSTNINVTLGEIPRVTLPALVVGATGYNVYLSDSGAGGGSEKKYNANPIVGTTIFDFAQAAPAGVVPPLANSTTPGATANVRITTSETIATSTTINSLTAAPAGGITITINAGQTLTIGSGGLLVTNAGQITFTGGGVVNFQTPASIGEGFIFANGATTFNQQIQGAGLSLGLTSSGASTLTFGGAAANLYTGITRTNAGTLQLIKTGDARAVPGDLIVGDGAAGAQDVVNITTTNQLSTTANVLVRGPALLRFPNNAGGITIGSLTMMSGANTTQLGGTLGNAIVETGTGTSRLILGTANTITSLAPLTTSFYFTGINTITGSGAAIGSIDLLGNDRTFSVADATSSIDLDMNVLIQGGGGGVIKTGPGSLLYRANNTYSGPTTVVGGTLVSNQTVAGLSQMNIQSGSILAGGVGTVNGIVTSPNVNIGVGDPTGPPLTLTPTGGGVTGGTLPGGTYYVRYSYTNANGETLANALTIPPPTITHGILDPVPLNMYTPPPFSSAGGGVSGGLLAAGSYFVRYTFVDSTGGETLPSAPSAPLATVLAGNIPQITLPGLPTGAVGYNIYLSDATGATGSETKYNPTLLGNIATYDLTAAAPGGVAPPTTNTTGHGIPQVTLPPLPPGATGYNIYLSSPTAIPGTERRYNTTPVVSSVFNFVGPPPVGGAMAPTSNTTAAAGSQAFVSPGPPGNPNGFVGNPNPPFNGTTITTRGIMRAFNGLNLNTGSVVILEVANFVTPGAPVAGTDFDQLIVNGTLSIAPGVKLVIDLAGFNNTNVGSVVSVPNAITFGTLAGTFSSIETINNPYGLAVFLQPNPLAPGLPTAYNILINKTAVPAPSSIVAVAPANAVKKANKKLAGSVQVYDGASKDHLYTIKAFPKKAPVEVAVGDVNGDFILDVVASQAGIVRVFDGTTGLQFNAPLGQFLPFGKGYTGGVSLATGDLDGDGVAEIITGRMKGPASVRAYHYDKGTNTLAQFVTFTAYPKSKTGVRVATGNFTPPAPTVQPNPINPSGGGVTGGLLANGTYYAAYTFVTPNGETPPSPVSASFVAGGGVIPQFVLPVTLPAGYNYNLYLSNNVAGPNSLTKYNTAPIATTNFNLDQLATGTAPPPKLGDQIYTAPGAKRAFNINVFSNTGAKLNANPIQPYGASYKKGGWLATGDLVGNDGIDDILVGPGRQSINPNIPVRVFNAGTLQLTNLLFNAFTPPGYIGPVRVALADADFDGIVDAFVARGNASKEIERWDLNAPGGPAAKLDSFFAFGESLFYNFGLNIAAATRPV